MTNQRQQLPMWKQSKTTGECVIYLMRHRYSEKDPMCSEMKASVIIVDFGSTLVDTIEKVMQRLGLVVLRVSSIRAGRQGLGEESC